MNRPILFTYQLAIGLSDTITGALLIIAPEFALRLMRMATKWYAVPGAITFCVSRQFV